MNMMGINRRFITARLRLEREWRIWNMNRQVKKHSQPRQGERPVVLFNASSRLSGFSQNAAFSTLTGWGLQLAGVPVIHFACHAGMSIYFTTMDDLISKLKMDKEASKNGKGRSYYKSTLVIVDEVGYTPIGRDECNLFYRFVAARYERSSTIITSNKAFTEWAEFFSDSVIVTAILDRLLHHSTGRRWL